MPKRPLKVLFTWHAAVVPGNRAYAKSLAAGGDLDVTLLIPERWDESTSLVEAGQPQGDGYRVIVGPVKNPYKGLSFYYPRAAEYLREVAPDAILLYEEPYSYAAWHFLYHARKLRPGIKFIFYTWQNLVCRYSFLRRQIERYVFRHSHLAIAGSKDVEDVLRTRGFAKPLRIVPLALDPGDFPAFEPAGLRQQLGLDGFAVGYVGRLTREKGLEDLIDALAMLKDRPVRALFVGGGPDEAALKARAEQAGIAGRILWLKGVPNQEMYKYYRVMDALVLPSRTMPWWKEQFGRVLIEAMISGTPVVGSSSGEIPRVVGDAGLVFPEGDAAALCGCLMRLLDEPDLGRRLAAAGKARVLANYTWERVGSLTREAILEACAGGG